MATEMVDFEGLQWDDTSQALKKGLLIFKDIRQNGSIALEGVSRRISGRHLRAGPEPWYLTIRVDATKRQLVKEFEFDYSVSDGHEVFMLVETRNDEIPALLSGAQSHHVVKAEAGDDIVAVRFISSAGDLATFRLDNVKVTT